MPPETNAGDWASSPRVALVKALFRAILSLFLLASNAR